MLTCIAGRRPPGGLLFACPPHGRGGGLGVVPRVAELPGSGRADALLVGRARVHLSRIPLRRRGRGIARRASAGGSRSVSLLGGRVELAVGDLSFISLRLVLPEIHGLLTDEGEAVLLIKPQFEVGRHGLGRRGVVTDPTARREAIEGVLAGAAEAGFAVLGLARSPLRGGEGNHEYLVHLTRRSGVGLTWQAQQVIAEDLAQEEAR